GLAVCRGLRQPPDLSVVMAGLDPATQPYPLCPLRGQPGPRVKPGDDVRSPGAPLLPRLLSLYILPARGLDALRRDPAIGVVEQGGDHRADVVGLREAAERRDGDEALLHLRAVADPAA